MRLYEFSIKTNSVEQFDAVIDKLERMGKNVSFYRNLKNYYLKREYFRLYGSMTVLVCNGNGQVSWTYLDMSIDMSSEVDIEIIDTDGWLALGKTNASQLELTNIVFEEK